LDERTAAATEKTATTNKKLERLERQPRRRANA
jgi:hypothetical protein